MQGKGETYEAALEEKQKYHSSIYANGPYELVDSGEFTNEGLIKFRYVIMRHAYTKFMPRKHELMEQRLNYLK